MFQKNLSANFVLIAVFVKVVLEITRELSIAFYLIHAFSFVLESLKCTCVQRLVECIRVICKTKEK